MKQMVTKARMLSTQVCVVIAERSHTVSYRDASDAA